MPNSMAIFDALFVCSDLQRVLKGAAVGEIHLFSYLACLLSIFKGQPSSEWGYSFAGVDQGSPFSVDLSEAIDLLIDKGSMVAAEDLLRLTDSGSEELAFFTNLAIYSDRRPFLSAACSSVLAIPIGTVRTAMTMEPGLRPVVALRSTRALLTDATLEQLYEDFSVVNQAVEGQTEDLMVPATVWLSYLAAIAQEQEVAKRGGETPNA